MHPLGLAGDSGDLGAHSVSATGPLDNTYHPLPCP